MREELNNMLDITNIKLEHLSAAEIGKLVTNKQIKPTEIINYFAKRIKYNNADINAFVYTKIDEAIEQAKLLE